MGCYCLSLYCRIDNYELHWNGSSFIGVGKYEIFLFRIVLLNDDCYGRMSLTFICCKNPKTKEIKIRIKSNPLRIKITKTRLIFILNYLFNQNHLYVFFYLELYNIDLILNMIKFAFIIYYSLIFIKLN